MDTLTARGGWHYFIMPGVVLKAVHKSYCFAAYTASLGESINDGKRDDWMGGIYKGAKDKVTFFPSHRCFHPLSTRAVLYNSFQCSFGIHQEYNVICDIQIPTEPHWIVLP